LDAITPPEATPKMASGAASPSGFPDLFVVKTELTLPATPNHGLTPQPAFSNKRPRNYEVHIKRNLGITSGLPYQKYGKSIT
jgi:hypothetical protein